MQFSGDQSGTLYLSGIPVLDTASGILDVSELDFQLNTNNLLMRTASWLFSKKILKELEKLYPLPHKKTTSIRSASKPNAQLSQPLVKGIRTEGQLDRLVLMRLTVGPNELGLRCRASGELDLSVDAMGW